MMRKLRVRRGVLQTPVIRYRHRRTGRTVTLVGTAHVGEASYYERLQAIVARLEAAGAVVCYEWIGSAAEEEWAAASAGERAARDASQSMGQGTFKQVGRSLGWVEQGAVFRWAPSWRNVDITDLELVRLASPEGMRAMGGALGDVWGSSLTQDQADAVTGAAAGVVFRLVSLDWFDLLRRITTWDDASRRFSRVDIEERNAHALARMPSGADVVLLWGAGHLPGLAAGLKQAPGERRRLAATARGAEGRGLLPSALSLAVPGAVPPGLRAAVPAATGHHRGGLHSDQPDRQYRAGGRP